MIPAFGRRGNLPPGIHGTTWKEFVSRFAWNGHPPPEEEAMIKNEREYRITKTQARRFVEALAQLSGRSKSPEGIHPWLVRAQKEAIERQLQSLSRVLSEYDGLRRRPGGGVDVSQIEELPDTLIQARIAAGLTQKELAERLGVKEQQVQRYEATRYASASLRRVLEVARAGKAR